MIIIAGYFQLDASDRDRYVDAHVELVVRARQTEGCVDLAISADPVDPTRVNNYELWDNEEDLLAWRSVANPPRLELDFRGGHMAKYYIAKTGPVFG
ncbi:antibiotic biosynthesis monooxygenase family protein [Kocuria aegyptia]|uniref:ABM domain-containing protein n=1 Tax=Kocuria aegyptia TaxID=330943 RepID=A0ABN2KGP5_9MICC